MKLFNLQAILLNDLSELNRNKQNKKNKLLT